MWEFGYQISFIKIIEACWMGSRYTSSCHASCYSMSIYLVDKEALLQICVLFCV